MTVDDLIEQLNAIEARKHLEKGFTSFPADKWNARTAKKFVHINCGGSGAFLLEIATGELYNIKAYGVADLNKKVKADIGNIETVDAEVLHSKRWNHLR